MRTLTPKENRAPTASMSDGARDQGLLPRALLLAVALGVMPHLAWWGLGFAGGVVIAAIYPTLAAYIGWTLHRITPGQCARPVLICAVVAALSFTGFFFASAPTGHFYGPLALAMGGVAVFVGALLAAGAFISLGVAARHVRTA